MNAGATRLAGGLQLLAFQIDPGVNPAHPAESGGWLAPSAWYWSCCSCWMFLRRDAHSPKRIGCLRRAQLRPRGQSRRFSEGDAGLSFKTPEAWLMDPGVRTSYEGLVFDRNYRGSEAAQKVLGVGHRAVEQALHQAESTGSCLASVPKEGLAWPLLVYQARDSLTGTGAHARVAVLGVEVHTGEANPVCILRDWELLERLNGMRLGQAARRASSSPPATDREGLQAAIELAGHHLRQSLKDLFPAYRYPVADVLAVLWPRR